MTTTTTTTPRSKGRTGRPWRRLQRQVYRDETVCGLCGEWVDQSLQWPHPMSKSVDHITPLSRGGAERDRYNLTLAHLTCNRSKSAGAPKQERTPASRDW